MNVRDIMTANPACCGPGTPIPHVAQLMVEFNCGEIPVVDPGSGTLVGVITDRDIACRAVARNENPLLLTARDCMSSPVVTVTPDMSIDDCCQAMETAQVRRVPVVDDRGACCGIVAQADLARKAPQQKAAEVVRDVSQPAETPSRVGLHP